MNPYVRGLQTSIILGVFFNYHFILLYIYILFSLGKKIHFKEKRTFQKASENHI